MGTAVWRYRYGFLEHDRRDGYRVGYRAARWSVEVHSIGPRMDSLASVNPRIGSHQPSHRSCHREALRLTSALATGPPSCSDGCRPEKGAAFGAQCGRNHGIDGTTRLVWGAKTPLQKGPSWATKSLARFQSSAGT